MARRRRRRRRAAAAAVGMAGPPPPGVDLLLPAGRPGAAGARRRAPPGSRSTIMSALAPTMHAFFTERLQGQRQASPHTIAAYRDTFRVLLAFAEQQTGKTASRLHVDDLNVRLITAFLGPPRARARWRGPQDSVRRAPTRHNPRLGIGGTSTASRARPRGCGGRR